MSASRKPLSKRVRFEIFKRDAFTCQYCGAHPPGIILHVDHIRAIAEGGSNEIDNLITACESCNLGKGARALEVAPETVAIKAQRVAEAEEQLRGYQEILKAKADRLEDETWLVAETLWPGCADKGASKADLLSIKRFIERLGVVQAVDFAELAVARKPHRGRAMWLYFCGCCWRQIKGELAPGVPR